MLWSKRSKTCPLGSLSQLTTTDFRKFAKKNNWNLLETDGQSVFRPIVRKPLILFAFERARKYSTISKRGNISTMSAYARLTPSYFGSDSKSWNNIDGQEKENNGFSHQERKMKSLEQHETNTCTNKKNGGIIKAWQNIGGLKTVQTSFPKLSREFGSSLSDLQGKQL